MVPFGGAQTHLSPGSYGAHRQCQKISPAYELVSCRRAGEYPAYFEESSMPNLPPERYGLQPPKALLASLPFSWAARLSRMPCCAPVNRTAAPALRMLRPGRCYLQLPALRHKSGRVLGLVGTPRDSMTSRNLHPHHQPGLPFGGAVGGQQVREYEQPVTVFHQPITVVAQRCLLARSG